MQEAVPAGTGAMAAILGLEDAEVEAACREAAQGEVVEPANFNSPGQVVIAGEAAAVERAIEAVQGARGQARRGAAGERARAQQPHAGRRRALAPSACRRCRCAPPHVRYLSAVDAPSTQDPDDIRALLVRQLSSPVRWSQTLQGAGRHRRVPGDRVRPGQGPHRPQPPHREARRAWSTWRWRILAADRCGADFDPGDRMSMLDTEVALVTGASRGIGLAIALALARPGRG